MTFSTISMEDLENYVDHEYNMQIIDLRNNASYQKCHFQNALSIPYQELDSKLGCLSKEHQLIFYCSRGGQSLRACNYLSQMGYDVVNIANGFSFYQGKYMVRT